MYLWKIDHTRLAPSGKSVTHVVASTLPEAIKKTETVIPNKDFISITKGVPVWGEGPDKYQGDK